jgi:LysM repeat protein
MSAKARGTKKGVSAFIDAAVDTTKKGKSKVKTNGKTKDYTSRDTPEVTKTLEDMRKPPSQRSKDATGTSRKKKPVVATKTNGSPKTTPPPGPKPLTTKQKVGAAAIGTGSALTAIGGAGVAIDRIRKRSHKVKSGDSLSKIAKQMGTTLKKLLQANNIKPKDANNIRIGQTIKVPPKGFALKSPKIYKGMSKSVMAKLHAETEKRKAANRKKASKVVKKAGGGMTKVGLSPAEMARAGTMSEAKRRRYAKKGGTVNRRGGGQIGVGSAYVQLQYDN